MNKKKTENKGNNDKLATAKKVVTLFKGETPYFMIGLLFVMFGVYLLLAFSSFLVSGGHDQSLVMHAETGELLRTDNGIQNVMGSSGAQLSQFLVNDCFGLASYIIIVFLIIAGMTDERLSIHCVEVVCRLFRIYFLVVIDSGFRIPRQFRRFIYISGRTTRIQRKPMDSFASR